MQQKLSLEEGKKLLGLLQQNFFAALKKNDLKGTLSWIEQFNQTGGNFKNLIEKLLDQLRISLLLKSGVNMEEADEVALETKDIILLMKLLTEAYNNLKISPIESLPLEIAVVEFYNRKQNPKS